MGAHEPFISKVVNQLLGPTVASILGRFGLSFEHGEKVIPDHVVMAAIVSIALIAVSLHLRRRLSVENPGRLQQIAELYVEGLRGLMESIIGHHDHRSYLPYLATLGLFILFCNLIGLIPGFMSPTSNYNVTLGCALMSFCYYHYVGIRKLGLFGYLKHFAGPVWWMAPLMIPIEIMGHLGRILSLSVRLFANIFGEDTIIAVFALLFPFLLPLPIMFLAVFTSLLQAFVFVLLTIIYISGAVAEEH